MIELADGQTGGEGSADPEVEFLGAHDFGVRACLFDDIAIRSDGDGRTVEAYAAVWDTRAEIKDRDGHYNETIERGSFNKTIADNGTRFGVFYNHGMTIWGTPDGQLSVPIGVPESVRADDRGVFTATRYLDNPLADSILDGIKQKAIRGQSFSGRWIKSSRTRSPKRGDLPLITRHEVAMKEYGPTPSPSYVEAEILGTRSVSNFLDEVARLDPQDVGRLRDMLGLATPLEPVRSSSTLSGVAAPEEPAFGHSARHTHTRLRARARKEGGPLS